MSGGGGDVSRQDSLIVSGASFLWEGRNISSQGSLSQRCGGVGYTSRGEGIFLDRIL